jgi:hypothetical protein
VIASAAVTRSRALPYLLAAVWLALGYANLARGAPRAGPGYRAWSFRHHAYSDVIALQGDRYLHGERPTPYLDDRIEYPVLLGWALWLPSHLPGGPRAWFTATYLVLAALLLVAIAALARLRGTAPLWLAGTPALVHYAGLNWDLLPIALLALAALAQARGAAATSGGLAALGLTAKLFPAAFGPPAFGALLARSRARAAAFALAAVAVLLAVNLPVALRAPENWGWFFTFNAGRGAENSAWHALGVPAGPVLELLSTGPLVVSTLLAAGAAFQIARRGGDGPRAARLGTALVLVVWIATNKVWSPQYALYGFLAGALVAAPWRLFWLASALAVADYHVAFEVRARRWEVAFRDLVFHPLAVARTVVWLGLAAWIGRELWRQVRSAPPRSAPPR